MTPRAPSWAFFLLPTRMGELLAGALLAVVGTQVSAIPAAVRAALAWCGLAVIVVACVRFDATMAWPGTAVLVPVVATMAVIVGGSVTRHPVGPGAGPARRRSAVGRPALVRAVPLALAAPRAGRGPLGPARLDRAGLVAVALAVGLSALSFRLVEDPVRHARWLAAVPARSLALGAAMVLVMLTSGWALARSIPALDGGEAAATPELARRRSRPQPSRRQRPRHAGADDRRHQRAGADRRRRPP